MMHTRYIIFVIFLIFQSNVLANKKIKVLTSIAPLAAIVDMLVKDIGEVVVIANFTGCPHDYNLRPGDLQKVKSADFVLYLDEMFEGFISKLLYFNNKNSFKISNIDDLSFIKEDGNINWHIWYDLSNVLIILKNLSSILTLYFPYFAHEIESNLDFAVEQVRILMKIKKRKLAFLKDVILFTDSLEYFFYNTSRVVKVYNISFRSLKHFNNVEALINSSYNKCLIFDKQQDTSKYKSFKANMVQIASEDWNKDDLKVDFFYRKYLSVVNQLEQCRKY